MIHYLPKFKTGNELALFGRKLFGRIKSALYFFIAKNENGKLLIMEMGLLFKHYPQIHWVSSFTVYAF